MLEINLKKQLGNVLIHVNFSIESTGVIAIFGESGAGKTSIINMVSGLIKPDSGYIKYNNKVLYDSNKNINVPVHKRYIGYVFQESRLFPILQLRRIYYTEENVWEKILFNVILMKFVLF